jgi:hypothetical protein
MDESRMEDKTARQAVVASRHHGFETFRPNEAKEHAALGFGALPRHLRDASASEQTFLDVARPSKLFCAHVFSFPNCTKIQSSAKLKLKLLRSDPFQRCFFLPAREMLRARFQFESFRTV